MTIRPSRDPAAETQAGPAFLAEASRVLAESLDYETTLATVASLALPYLGAWCIVDLLRDGDMRRAAVIHQDPAMQALARKLAAHWPPHRDDPLGIPRAMVTKKTETIPEVPDEMLVQVSRTDENLRILRELGMGSLLVVPLQARGQVLGAITYVSPRDGRAHDHDDVVLAEELAARCAIALDNARLLQEAEAARDRAEESARVTEQARLEALEANDAKTQFLRTISHELRTPLNAMGAYVELLQMGLHGPLTERQQEDLRRMQISQRHLQDLIGQILDYAQLGAKRMAYTIRDTPVAELVEEVDSIIAPVARAKDIAYGGCPQPDFAIRADPQRTRQILVNVLSNAIKFTERGGSVAMVCEATTERVFLRVRDSGAGIASQDQERIFEPFVQLSRGLTRTEQGTGLGLSISRDLARGMGGDLLVESAPGAGSTFTLDLPRAS